MLELFYMASVGKHYPYRRAEVYNRVLEIRNCREFHAYLAAQHERPCDNHECYELKSHRGPSMYVQFSDGVCWIGLSIVEADDNG